MRLAQLLGGVDVLEVRGDPASLEVVSVTHDSRHVTPGALFCCVTGAATDGHDHAPAAVVAGAAALLCERLLPLDVAQVRVASTRRAMAPVAAAFHGHPSDRLRVAGVTGTNGKTTTTHLLRAVLEHHGWPTEVIGTLSGARTTPEATELQARLAAARRAGAQAVAMEVSSHSLVQHRVDGTRFAVAAFTNLSQDHLDYHGTMEAYFEAKASLFTPERAGAAVVNADDAYGRRLLERVRARGLPVHAFSPAVARVIEATATSTTFAWEGCRVSLAFGGSFNVANAVCAATVAVALGVAPGDAAAGLVAAAPVPGRFEPVDAGQPFAVIVDYAHTPDALDGLLSAARRAAPPAARTILVFGCGGDRDRAKRPAMGRVAAAGADQVIVTSDNPRSERPEAIIADILAGVPDPRRVTVEPDRAAAVALAVGAARPGDVVLLAGKGHETGQTTGDTTVPFDDREVARRALEQLRQGQR